MTAYIIRRLLIMIPTLLLISFLTFVIIDLPPGDFASSLQTMAAQGGSSVDAAALKAYRVRYGLDKPFVERYLYWVSGFPRGDFGMSFAMNIPVADLIWSRLALTILLGGAALVVMWVVAVPIGIYSATHQYSWLDNLLSGVTFLGLSIPDFLLALGFLYVAAFHMDIGVGGVMSAQYENAPWTLDKIIDVLLHVIPPVLILAAGGTAQLVRIMRSSLLDILQQQHVTTARSKGLKERKVINKYAVRIAINPLVSVMGMEVPKIISSTAIIGIVLSIETTGPLFLNSLIMQDMYLAGTLLLLMSVILMASNLAADIVLAWVDPRIQLQ